MKSRLIFVIFMKLPVGIGAESKVLGVVMGPVRGGLGMEFISAASLISSKTPLARRLLLGLIVSSIEVS
jgi:hypothetical protein